MGTSNWQQIPFCIDALMKINPERVLDIGVGFGRWGMITREFCDVWYSRVFEEDWKVKIDGIEGFARSITDYHKSFYNTIHIGDAAKIIPTLPDRYSVTIYGDVLEHFTREKAEELLNISLDRSDYVLVNIPIGEEWTQEAVYENVYERHLSSWVPEDFDRFSMVKRLLLRDYIGRPYGSFVLSRNDPKNLRAGLFSPVSDYRDAFEAGVVETAPAAGAADGELDRVLDRVAEQAFELSFIKRSRQYQMAQKVRDSRLGAWIGRRGDHGVTIRALGEKNPASQSTEVWMVHVGVLPGERSIPWDFVRRDASWKVKDQDGLPYGRCMLSTKGEAFVRLSANPELKFVRHPWSGKVEITFGGRREVIDLYSPESEILTVHPARSPMVRPTVLVAAGTAGSSTNGFGSVVARAGGGGLGLETFEVTAPGGAGFTAYQERFIERVRQDRPQAVAISPPCYLGVTSSTVNLFEHTYLAPETREERSEEMDAATRSRHARALAECPVDRYVFSGGDHTQHAMMQELKSIKPGARCDLFFHGSYPQFCEDVVWEFFKKWIESARKGEVYSIASDKWGYDEFIRSLGLRGHVLLNRIEGVPQGVPEIMNDGQWHVGMWLSGSTYRKIPHAMLSALSIAGNVRLRGAGLDARALEVIRFLGLKTDVVREAQLPHDRLFEEIRKTHATLYVTLIECCPMLPLESLHLGVPALLGPNSHLFEDNRFLFERLVVSFPERAEVIAEYLKRAIAEREAIVAEYQRWVPGYEARSRESVRAFLSS